VRGIGLAGRKVNPLTGEEIAVRPSHSEVNEP
jgi:hypothetical protein